MSQQGGADWFVEHLKLNGFDPIVFDGRDPAAFVWAIFEMESRLEARAEAIRSRNTRYPVPMPYGIAIAPKGAGFYGEGTNLAHNLPLMSNPYLDPIAAKHFNESAKRLWVGLSELKESILPFQNHQISGRSKERDHALVDRKVTLKQIPTPILRLISLTRQDSSSWTRSSPMVAIDSMFQAILQANPHLRPRVGNPDEMRSNRLIKTLEYLKFRVTDPEPGIPEDIHGGVITALNEEAVASAALANKGGINLFHTYEAFGTKMHGVVRQEIIFADHCNEVGRRQGWLSVPLILTSHTWENAKNERSHQDPSMAEAMLGEPSDVSRVLFIPDFNTASLVIHQLYQTHGQIWTLVVPKAENIPELFTLEEGSTLLQQGALRLGWAGYEADRPRVILTAIGAYQLEEVLKASARLKEKEISHSVIYMIEPGRFRSPRTDREKAHLAPSELQTQLYPKEGPARLFVTHTRPEILLGVLHPLNTGSHQTVGLGFINQGGTLNVPGMLFVNRCTWAHILQEVTRILSLSGENLLSSEERAALSGKISPEGILF